MEREGRGKIRKRGKEEDKKEKEGGSLERGKEEGREEKGRNEVIK